MSTITHVCMSDLHLGAESSLLTDLGANGVPDYLGRSPVLMALVDCLRDLLDTQTEKPTLVLAGDILELALAQTHEAAMCFEGFLQALFPGDEQDLFARRILLLPGNHDHHLWEVAREQHYVDFLGSGTVPAGERLSEAWSVTRLYESQRPVGWPRSKLLEALAGRHPSLADLQIQMVYPNLGLRTQDHSRCVVFTHGHYIEPIYMAMSWLRGFLFPESERRESMTISEIERENFAWIDFFWSTMGRSGAAGERVQQVYEMTGSSEGIETLSKRIAEGVVEHWGRPLLPDGLEVLAIERLLAKRMRAFVAQERGQGGEALSEETEKGLVEYIAGPLRQQINYEGRDENAPQGRLPGALTVVFGHTHKPFERRKVLPGFTRPVDLINTGGWVVDTIEQQPLHGAALVLVNDAYDVASLRMYDEPARGAAPGPVRVAAAFENPLAAALRARIDSHGAGPSPWATFSAEVDRGICLRVRALALRSK